MQLIHYQENGMHLYITDARIEKGESYTRRIELAVCLHTTVA
jgi:hypothetical protein